MTPKVPISISYVYGNMGISCFYVFESVWWNIIGFNRIYNELSMMLGHIMGASEIRGCNIPNGNLCRKNNYKPLEFWGALLSNKTPCEPWGTKCFTSDKPH
jgi:hypothetical protein